MEPIKITSKTHIMISGGAGFIGFHLSRRLLNAGAKVTILTKHTHSQRAMQLAQEGATIVPCDVTAPSGIPMSDSFRNADVFYHLAADVSVSGPNIWATNVAGTQRALDLAGVLNIPYVVFASSIEAQGLGSEHEIPLGEHNVCRPVSEYGASKAKAEEIVSQWARASGRKTLVLRIGNIYGPGSAWLIRPSIMALLGLSPLAGAWPQLQHRVLQPLYIDDFIEGMFSAVSQGLTGLYNITGEEPVTVGSYLQTLASLLQLSDAASWLQIPPTGGGNPMPRLDPDFAYLMMGTPDQCHRSYDNTKLHADIGSYARWSLARGLASTLHWMQQSDLWPALLATVRRRAEEGVCTSH